MKTIKLTIFSILGATLLGLGLYSCSNDDSINNNEQIYKYTSKEVNITNIIKNDTKYNKKVNILDEELNVYSILYMNIEIPEKYSQYERQTFVEDNLNKLNGKIEYYFNDELERVEIFEQGVVVESYNKDEEYPRANECSFEGVRQCANKAIYSMGLVGKILCAFEFYACYAQQAADCTIDNCTNLNK